MNCQGLFSLKKKKKMSSAAIVIGALRVNIKINKFCFFDMYYRAGINFT